jgi:glycosyltransferase involved in cell wall biosynthesis
VREKYRLGSDRVVSLIGLTFSQDLYFLEAIEIARRRLPNLKCLLVGKSELLERALVRFKGPENGLVYTGPVPYSEIQDYFAASDVGLYPGDDSEFFQAASPIKIFEYTAARKYVVSSRLEEMEKLGWGNLVFAEPSGNSFAEGILTALKLMESRQFPATTVAEYDWDTLTRKLEELLQESQG